jgi:hypothetical protein
MNGGIMINSSIHPSNPFAGMVRLVIASCIVFSATVSADSLQAGIDTFFIRLSGEFDRIAANPAVKKRRPAIIDAYFLRQLKRHQVVRSITRTDAKGVRVTEMVRIKGANHEKQSMKKEQWFAEIVKGAREYHTLERDTGRYYLIWSKPVVAAGAAKKIAGVVMMKIDLWDCFQELSNSAETPFLVFLKKTRFYDHKWKKTYEYDEVPLSVPGANEMTLRVQKIVAAAVPAPDSNLAVAKPESTKIDSTPAQAGSTKPDVKTILLKYKKIVIVAGIVGVLFLGMLVVLLVSWIKNKMVIRAINREV